MKKLIFLSGALLIINFPCLAQIYKGQVNSNILPKISSSHYIPEYTLDFDVNPQLWQRVKPGLHAAFGSEDELYFRTESPQINDEAAPWNATGWKGERLNTQIVVWSTDTLEQVRFKVNNLKNDKGKILGKDNIQLNKVCYVLANYPYGSPDAICGETPYKNGYLIPDRFETFDRFDLPAKTVRPVWISCDVPSTADAGTYKGTIEVTAGNSTSVLNIQIKVQNHVLPKPHDWHYRLDLWQNPWVIADYYHVKPWSTEHKVLLKQHLKLYANAGGTYITTYGVHSPWGDNEYPIEGGMIEWIKTKNGSWKFNYDIFDQYVELAMSVGIDKAITLYTPIPWGERFRYKDESTGKYVYEQWQIASDTYKNSWNTFLTALKAHLKNKGWFKKTYLGINENEMQQTLTVINFVKKNSNDWKITYAGNWHKELDSLVDDYSFLYGNEATTYQIQTRKANEQTTTYYVCCNPAKPNNFLFSPPVEGRWISWYAAAHGYSGFLRWAYDSWPEDPMRDARYGSWAAGDCYLVYPGGNSCIRFEKLREGIVDYEKIKILRELGLRSTNVTVKSLVFAFEAYLKKFDNEKEFNEVKLKKDIEKGRAMINELSEKIIH